MTPKPRKCKVCRTEFTPRLPMATCCGSLCALSLARSKRARAAKVAQVKERRADKIKKESQKTRSEWLKEAQTSFNAWVRARDEDLACISCGRHHTGQYQAGHYLSVGARPEMRYVENNCHKQCAPCNNHLSGNIVLYRPALIEKIGLAAVEELEGPHEKRKYTVDDLKAIKTHYAAETKTLKARQE